MGRVLSCEQNLLVGRLQLYRNRSFDRPGQRRETALGCWVFAVFRRYIRRFMACERCARRPMP